MSELNIDKVNGVKSPITTDGTTTVESTDASKTKPVLSMQVSETDEYKPSDKTDAEQKNNTVQVETDTPASKLDKYDLEKQTTQDNADAKKSAIKDEIEDLIKNDKTISDNIKKEYIELNKEQKAKSEQLQKKQKELDELKRNVDIAQAEIIRRQTEKEEVQDKSRKSEIDKEIKQYLKNVFSDNKKIDSLTSEIKTLNNSIS